MGSSRTIPSSDASRADPTGIKTPETHPDHDVVGRYFAHGMDGHIYYCDSYDPRIGFWMTRADAPRERWADDHSEFRRNVSERAIGRTIHRIWIDPDGHFNTTLNGWTRRGEFLATVAAHRAALTA